MSSKAKSGAPGVGHGTHNPSVKTDSLLARPLPEGYREEWARHFAEPERLTAEEDDSDERTVVLFRIGDEWLALSARLFHEVTQPRRYHSLPHRRDTMVLGIANVRGELIVCVSLAALLGIARAVAPERNERTKTFARLLVIGEDTRRVAFEVDEVHGVHRFEEGDALAVPATLDKAAAFTRFVINWNGRAAGRLDDTLLFAAVDRGIG